MSSCTNQQPQQRKSNRCGKNNPNRHKDVERTPSSCPKLNENQQLDYESPSPKCPKMCPKHAHQEFRGIQPQRTNQDDNYCEEVYPKPTNREHKRTNYSNNKSNRQGRNRNNRKEGNCSNIGCGRTGDVCESYQKFECNDSIWTIKIMKDSANTANIPKTPAVAQTSMTTVINATKLEGLLPNEQRYVNKSIPEESNDDTSHFPGGNNFTGQNFSGQTSAGQNFPQQNNFPGCKPCIETHNRSRSRVLCRSNRDDLQNKDSKMDENQGHEPRAPPNSRARSGSSEPGSCLCCRKRKHKTKRRKRSKEKVQYQIPCDDRRYIS